MRDGLATALAWGLFLSVICLPGILLALAILMLLTVFS